MNPMSHLTHLGSVATGEAFVDGLFDLFRTVGQDHYDEAVSQVDHALQTAALAERDRCPDALVAACLLHDVGHLVSGPDDADAAYRDRDLRHERVGAALLARWFDREVTEPVRLHVSAKRYLITVDPGYRAGLSPSSIRSLELQGGSLSDPDRATLEAEPHLEAGLRLRRFDDGGKVVGMEVRPLDEYRPLVLGLVRAVPSR